jgi:hypothetical protein
MANTPPTIIDLKLSFLSSQIRALSQPLTPSTAFTDSNSASEEDQLRQKHIDDALHKLNERVKRHNKLKYGTQAQRHVAEQIDRLYWNAGERGVVTLESGEEWVERGSDYRGSLLSFLVVLFLFRSRRCARIGMGQQGMGLMNIAALGQEKTISLLPPTWSEEAETKSPAEAQRYKELQARLVALNEERAAARRKVENHRRLKALVDAFKEDGGVQENLVARNGEVEMELERMRRLVVRVERGLEGLDRGGQGGRGEIGGEDDEDVGFEGEEERQVLALWG